MNNRIALASPSSGGAESHAPAGRLVAAPVVAGRADWSASVPVQETADLWRRRALLWRRQRDLARASLADERVSP